MTEMLAALWVLRDKKNILSCDYNVDWLIINMVPKPDRMYVNTKSTEGTTLPIPEALSWSAVASVA